MCIYIYIYKDRSRRWAAGRLRRPAASCQARPLMLVIMLAPTGRLDDNNNNNNNNKFMFLLFIFFFILFLILLFYC